MNANEYQQLTGETEIYSKASRKFLAQCRGAYQMPEGITDRNELFLSLAYCTGKLNGEAGEVAELVFKALRDGDNEAGLIEPDRAKLLFKELGDVMWYVSRIADLLGFKLEDVMQANIDKLMDRKERGVLSGSGDNR